MTQDFTIDSQPGPRGEDGAGVVSSGAPIGLRMATVLVVAFAAISLWSVSVPGTYFLMLMTLPTVWIGLGLAWLYLAFRIARRISFEAAVRNGWLLGMAAIVVATATAIAVDLPMRIRFEASRPAMDALAAELTAPGAPETLPDRWIGLFDAEAIQRVDGGFRFLVKDTGFLDPAGFAYSPAGEPPVIGEDWYAWLAGPWWILEESW